MKTIFGVTMGVVVIGVACSSFFTIGPVQVSAASQALGRLQEIEETGSVQWISDWDAAKVQAAKTGRPMLVLFQEIPG
ncbi:MAG: hypothetical protein ACI87E_001070 [Mariniblastus sp.]|jgi:hypothetical protein